MDILLSHGYFIAEDAHEQQVMKPYPTLGLLYISSHLKSKGFEVDLFDTTFSSLAEFERHVKETRPNLVGLYCNLMTKRQILKQVPLCKEVGARVVLGGPEPVNYAQEYLDSGADIIVSGEGETTLEELIPHLGKQGMSELEKVSGIVFRGDDGQLVRTPAREQIKDLSAQPWPDRAALDMDAYLDTWKTHHGMSSVSLITARGCPYTCNWCSHSVFGFSHRRRTPEDVVEEVAWIAAEYDPDQLWYADDVLTIQPRWFLRYAELLAERELRIPFECISRADRLNDKVIDALAGAGCYRLWIGAESGSQRILDAMERKTDAADIRAKTKMLQERGISVGMFIMLGYEGEEVADIEETVNHLKKSNPDIFLTTVAYPIKGTKYHDMVEERILTHLDWEARTDRDLNVGGRYSAQFYEQATRWMVNEVNFHKARLDGSRDYGRMAKMYVNAKRGRIGMRLARGRPST
jgi:anaerobic magnesium-protoporphyrin IX monomethyl ester cyclase